MSRHEPAAPGPLARRDGEPAFDEPWQAQVMALAYNLIEQGAFSNAQWSDTLGAELRAASERGEPDDAGTYYLAALAALQSLLAGNARVAVSELEQRTEAWRRAYRNTPHGEPVELPAGVSGHHAG